MSKTTLDFFQQVPIEELTEPKSGIFHVRVNEFWPTVDGNVLFFVGRNHKQRHYTSPQCNVDRVIAEKVAQNYDFEVVIQQLPVVYVPVSLSDY